MQGDKAGEWSRIRVLILSYLPAKESDFNITLHCTAIFTP